MRRSLLLLALIAWLLTACDGLDESSSDESFDDDTDAAAYLIVGGGLSETLSVLRVDPGPEFSFFADVVPTGAGVNDAAPHGAGLVTVCSLSNSLVVYDADLDVTREVSVGAGANPMNLALVGDGTVWVSAFLPGELRHLDLGPGVDSNARLLATVGIPPDPALGANAWSRPNDLALLDGAIFVTLSNLSAAWTPAGPGQLAVVDAAAGALEERIALAGRDPIGLTWDETRSLLWVVSAGDYDEDGFVGNGLLEGVDPETRQVERTIPIDGAPFEMVVAADLAYLGNGKDGRLLVVDLDEGEQRDSIDLRRHDSPGGLSFISALAVGAGGLIYAADFNSDYLYVLDPAADHNVIFETLANDGPDTLTWLR
jgi:DNA-binding beta-propeller fold protein YncE